MREFAIVRGKVTGYYGSSKNVEIPPKIDGEWVTSLGNWLFEEHSEIESIVIPDTVEKIERGVFYRCEGLTSIYLPRINVIEDDTFRGCISLRHISLPDTIAYIGTNAFQGCISLQSIELPRNLVEIGWESFKDCKNLRSIKMHNNVEIVGGEAFKNCFSLKDIEFSKNLRIIDERAFEGCSSLRSITLPEKLEEIRYSAFYLCEELREVKLNKNLKDICSYAFYATLVKGKDLNASRHMGMDVTSK